MRFITHIVLAAMLATGALFVQSATAQSLQPRMMQEELANLQREREQLMAVVEASWKESPVSTTCALIGLGTAGAIILEQVDPAFRSELNDSVRGGLLAGSLFCSFYCSMNSEATCMQATMFLGRVAVRLSAIAGRERELRTRLSAR